MRSQKTYNAPMNTPNPKLHPMLSEDDVNACVRVLRAIEADRSHLARLTPERRRELLMLAGLVAKPERHDVTRMAKAFRRAKREVTKEHDRRIIERAGLRIQRRSKVYAPLWLERPKPDTELVPHPAAGAIDGPDRSGGAEFHQERNCYVCKKSFAKMHLSLIHI